MRHSLHTTIFQKEEFLGLRRPKNRSLLFVNEDFEGKHDDKTSRLAASPTLKIV